MRKRISLILYSFSILTDMSIDYNYSHIMSLSCFRYLQNSFFPKEKYNVKCENLCDIDRNFLFGKSFSFKRILLRWRSKSLFVVQHENCLWARSWYHNRFQNAKWVTNYHLTFTHVIHKSRFLSLSLLFSQIANHCKFGWYLDTELGIPANIGLKN